MGLPRWEVAGKEMGRPICHMTWGFQAGDGTSKMGSGRSRDGKTNCPQETWLPRWGAEGNEMGRRIYHRRCDVQDGKWQVMRWEDEFTTWHGTSKIGSGRYWDGKTIDHRRWDFQAGDGTSKMGSGRQLRWEDEFTTGDGTSKIGRGRSWDGKTSLPQEMGRPRWEVAGNEMGRRITTGDGTSKMGSGK